MDKFATENLILLEFLVDQVNLEHSVKKELLTIPGETCVSFQFLDNSPLMVSEEDFAPKSRNYGSGCDCSDVKNGKSCLFSLTPQQAEAALTQFDIYVEVFKKTESGTLPDKAFIGESLISIVNLFQELVESSAQTDETVSKTLKDCFKIENHTGDLVGYISVYIRMSCFGKLIVTQFQMNLQDNSVEFKAKEGHYLFKYNKKENGGCPSTCPLPQPQTSPCSNPQPFNCPPPPSCFPPPQPPCYPPPQPPCLPPPQPPCYPPPQPPCSPPPQPPCSPPPKPPCYPPPQPPCYPKPPCYPPPPTSVNLNKNCPQVPCYPPPPPKQEQYCTSAAASYKPEGADEGNYQEIGASMGGNSLRIRVHKGQKGSECACEEDSQTNPPFTLKVNGCEQASNNVSVIPPVCTAADGTKVAEVSDPDKEVFILRIGKKSEGVNRKNNLELELCTPKGKDVKPPPKLETRDTQYDEKDVPPAAAAKGGKKGKGDKGGKGKGKGKKGKKGKK